MDPEKWFEVKQLNTHTYIIRERLDQVDPRFLTKYTNLYLLIGKHSAILFDAGSGISDLQSIILPLIENRKLYVILSHNHFDHIAGSNQFDAVHIHRFDLKPLMSSFSVDFLKTSLCEITKIFAPDYQLSFSDVHLPLIGNEIFDLGGMMVEVVFTPGHTPGSICLVNSEGELFTGDTFHFGSVYLPSKEMFEDYLHSLIKLNQIILERNVNFIYPAHEKYEIHTSSFEKFHQIIQDKVFLRNQTYFNSFLDCFITEYGQYRFVIPKEYYL